MGFNLDEFNNAGTYQGTTEVLDAPEDSSTPNWGSFESRVRESGIESSVMDTHIWGVDSEESGVTHNAPYDIQSTMSYTPTDSYQFTLKHMLKREFPEAADNGHFFDVYQDKDSGKYVYTDPEGNKTWVEPPGIDIEDITTELVPMGTETVAGAMGGAAGFATPAPGGTIMGAAAGSGVGAFAWRAQDLKDRLDKGLLDPSIYGTAEEPNYLSLFNETSKHGALSAVGSVGGDVLTKAFGMVFNKTKDKFIEKKLSAIVDDAIVEGVKKKNELFTEEEFEHLTTGQMLARLAEHKLEVASGRGEKAAAQKLQAVSRQLQEQETEFLGNSNISTELREKLFAQGGYIYDQYKLMLNNAGLPHEVSEALTELQMRDKGKNIQDYVMANHDEYLKATGKRFKSSTEELQRRIDTIVGYARSPDKAGSQIKSTINYAKKRFDDDIDAEYKSILQMIPNGSNNKVFDLTSFTMGPFARWNKQVGEAVGEFDVNKKFIGDMKNDLFEMVKTVGKDGNEVMVRQIKKLDYAGIDKTLKKLRQRRRQAFNANDPSASFDRDMLKEFIGELENIRADGLENIVRGNDDALDRLLHVEHAYSQGRRTFDSDIVLNIMGGSTKEADVWGLVKNAGPGDRDYLKDIMKTHLPDAGLYSGDALYQTIRRGIFNEYRKKVLGISKAGKGSDILEMSPNYYSTKQGEHAEWLNENDSIVKEWLTTADREKLKSVEHMAQITVNEQGVWKELLEDFNTLPWGSKKTGPLKGTLKDTEMLFHKTWGAGKVGDSQKLHNTLHRADGTIKPGAEDVVADYQSMIMNDMNQTIIKRADAGERLKVGNFIDQDAVRKYLKDNTAKLDMWLGADTLQSLQDVLRLSEVMESGYKGFTNAGEGDAFAKAMMDMGRAYVGMFTTPGRMLTAGKRIRARGTNRKQMERILSPALAAAQISKGDRSLFKRMFFQVFGKSETRAGEPDAVEDQLQDPASKFNLDEFTSGAKVSFKNGGVVHDYQLPTLKRPDHVDDMIQGYAEGGYVTQDQMQGMMQQMSGVQPTLQATPVVPPLQEPEMAMPMAQDTGVMSVIEQQAPVMTKKQKEKARVRAVKKGNKRGNAMPPPKTGILSGF